MSALSVVKSLKDNPALYSPWPERIVLCVAVLAAYASVWPNEFVFDDKIFIVQNALGKHWDTVAHFLTSPTFTLSQLAGAYYRPVPELLHFIVYRLFGLSTVAYHALSLLLQALNACLLYHFGMRAGFKKGAAFAAALLWAVHPLHTEAVAYMSATSELLWSTFCLCGLIALLPVSVPGAEQTAEAFAPRRIGLALIFFVLALCSKGSAVVFPALAVAALFFFSRGRAQFSAYLKTWPLWLLAAGYTIAWMAFVHMTGFSTDQTRDLEYFSNYTSNMANRTLVALATLPVYARLIVWPEGLHMEWGFPVVTTLLQWRPAAGALMAGLSFALIVRVWFCAYRNTKGSVPQRGPTVGLTLSFGLLWVAAALFPASGIAVPINGVMAERWMYMPTMGLFLCITQIAADLLGKKKKVAQLLVLVLALSLGTKTFFQNETWRNTETFYFNIVQNGGLPYRIMGDLGGFYLEHREFDKAIGLAQWEINHPVGNLAELHAAPYMLLAVALLQFQPDIGGDISDPDDIIRFVRMSPHLPAAIDALEQTLQADPDYALAHQYLAIIYRYQGNNEKADFHDREAKEILQQQEIYGRQLIPHTGLLYLQWGEYDKAIKLLQYEADHTEGLSSVLKAEAHLKLAMAWLHIRPDKNGISFTLDMKALSSSTHIPEAVAELEKATLINPDFYFAQAVLALLYRQQGDTLRADFHQKQADAILRRQSRP